MKEIKDFTCPHCGGIGIVEKVFQEVTGEINCTSSILPSTGIVLISPEKKTMIQALGRGTGEGVQVVFDACSDCGTLFARVCMRDEVPVNVTRNSQPPPISMFNPNN